MFVWNLLKSRGKDPERQGKLIAKIPMKMIFIDEKGQGFEYKDGHFIYRFSTYIDKSKSSK